MSIDTAFILCLKFSCFVRFSSTVVMNTYLESCRILFPFVKLSQRDKICWHGWKRGSNIHKLQTFISWFINEMTYILSGTELSSCVQKNSLSEKEKQRNRMALLETSISLCSEALSAHMSVFSTISVFSTETTIHLRHPLYFHVGLTLRFLVKSVEVSMVHFAV